MRSLWQHYASRKRTAAWPIAWGRGPCRMSLAVCLGLSLLMVGSSGPTLLVAQDEDIANREYRIKAAYLYQFGRYVEWPAKSFSDANAPFVIGVLGQDPVIVDLEQIARIKKIQDRSIQIRRFASAADVRPCNILYIPAAVSAEVQAELIRTTAGQGTLLVGDASDFLGRGGVVQFSVEENSIRVAIARKAADREGLKISAKLLQVARVVE
jgi:hypothetical protein